MRVPWPFMLLLQGVLLLEQQLLLLLVSAGLQQHPLFAAAGDFDNIPRGPAPHTMLPHEGALPLLQTKTLFIIDNEPVIESHIASNLLHQLLYSLGVQQHHVRVRDEAYLFKDSTQRQATEAPARWLAAEAATMPDDIEFVFIGTAYTRIDPKTLESLLADIKEEETSEKNSPLGPFILGWGLFDEKPAIMHHFAKTDSLLYPHLDAGTLWSRAAFETLGKSMTGEKAPKAGVERDFLYEIFLHLKNTDNLQLLHSELFCPLPPLIENYDRAHAAYPPPHARPKRLPGAEASAKGNKQRKLSPIEKIVIRKAEHLAEIRKGCAAFSSGTRHAPILSHQMFDALIDFDEELMVNIYYNQ